ncbi:MAG: TolC family protein [Myxococcota bacterium]
MSGFAWVLTFAAIAGEPLSLDAVLQSTRTHYPKLTAAERKIDEARGKLLANRGSFDLKMKAKADRDVLGFYDKTDLGIGLEQGLSFGGIDLEGGYRYGEDFPPYDGKRVTSEQGEAFFGANIPLWQDRAIDARRLGVRMSEIQVELEGLNRSLTELQVLGKATTSYWKWVSAGQKKQIIERLLELAEVRQDGVRRQVEQGSAPEILLRDNMRLIVSRRGLLVSAELELTASALNLSLFYRDSEGLPVVPEESALPKDFPDPSPVDTMPVEEHLTALQSTRPDLVFFGGLMRQVEFERSFGENLGAPTVDLKLKASQDVGDSVFYGSSSSEKTINEAEVGVGLSFSLPLQRRKGRGEVMRTSAALERLRADSDLAAQQANAELRQAYLRLEAAVRQVELVREAYALSLQLEEAERRKFSLGQSNLLFVNQREVTTANDATKVVSALQTYQEALALYRVARGVWQ